MHIAGSTRVTNVSLLLYLFVPNLAACEAYCFCVLERICLILVQTLSHYDHTYNHATGGHGWVRSHPTFAPAGLWNFRNSAFLEEWVVIGSGASIPPPQKKSHDASFPLPFNYFLENQLTKFKLCPLNVLIFVPQ